MQPELIARKILGRNLLNENRFLEALELFNDVLADYPDDLETLLTLGNLYLIIGKGKTAKNINLRAQQVDPDNQAIEYPLTLAEEKVKSDSGESDPTGITSVARLFKQLTGNTKSINENDLSQAASMLESIVNSESPAEMVAKNLDKIDELLPALIELNIRQALADGRSDLIEGLWNLQLNIEYQLMSKKEDVFETDQDKQGANPLNINVLMLLPNPDEKSSRMTLLKQALESNNCSVSESMEYIPRRDDRPDIAITSNPHTNPGLIDSLSALSAAEVPIILDLDSCFELLPVSHSDYSAVGLGSQARSNAYMAALSLAHTVCAPSEMQIASLRGVVKRTCVIHDGWSQKNKLYEKAPYKRATINIGWVGKSGQLEDLVSIRRIMIRIVREFPNTRIVIIGNSQAFRLFDNLPENRRLYLPQVAHEEYPFLLKQLDVLLVPSRSLPYNLSLSDSILVEAGAVGIPWIASSIPAFSKWAAGGIISESLDEWHRNLRHLVMDVELRNYLAKSGKIAAMSREMNHLGRVWMEMIYQIIHNKAILSENKETIPNFSMME